MQLHIGPLTEKRHGVECLRNIFLVRLGSVDALGVEGIIAVSQTCVTNLFHEVGEKILLLPPEKIEVLHTVIAQLFGERNIVEHCGLVFFESGFCCHSLYSPEAVTVMSPSISVRSTVILQSASRPSTFSVG